VLKHRFLIHSLHHNWISSQADEGKEQMVPSLSFQSWGEAERHFRALGAKGSMIEEAFVRLKRSSVAVLTMMDHSERFGQESE